MTHSLPGLIIALTVCFGAPITCGFLALLWLGRKTGGPQRTDGGA